MAPETVTFEMPPSTFNASEIKERETPLAFTVSAGPAVRLKWRLTKEGDGPDILDLMGPSGSWVVRLKKDEQEIVLNRYSLVDDRAPLDLPRAEFPGFESGKEYLVQFGSERVDLRRAFKGARDGLRRPVKLIVR